MKLGMFKGFREWRSKIEKIAKLGLPVDDFYMHLEKEAKELFDGRDSGEMIDVINTAAMCYTVGQYNVSFQDCLDKLKQREKKYETERQTP